MTKKPKPTPIKKYFHTAGSGSASNMEDINAGPQTQPAASKSDFSLLMNEFKELKDEIKGMRSDLQRNVQELKGSVDQLGDRVNDTETDIATMHENFQGLQDQVNKMQLQLSDMSYHTEDLENRLRRDNVRIRGVPEKAEGSNIHTFLQDMFARLLGDSDGKRIKMDRAHRVNRSMRRARDRPETPRDILVKLHNFQEKAKILSAARDGGKFLVQEQEVLFFDDLSATTLQRRREMRPLTSRLQADKVRYKWGFPFSLMFRYKGRNLTVRSLSEAERLMGEDHPPQPSTEDETTPPGPSRTVRNNWKVVDGRAIRIPGIETESPGMSSVDDAETPGMTETND